MELIQNEWKSQKFNHLKNLLSLQLNVRVFPLYIFSRRCSSSYDRSGRFVFVFVFIYKINQIYKTKNKSMLISLSHDHYELITIRVDFQMNVIRQELYKIT